jgi:vesicle-fusing ATPase
MAPPVLKVNKASSDALALTNCLIVNKHDFQSSVTKYLLVNQLYVFTVLRDDSCAQGECGTSLVQRKWANLSINESIQCQPYDPIMAQGQSVYMSQLVLEIDYFNPAKYKAQQQQQHQQLEEYDAAEMSKKFSTACQQHMFTRGQQLLFEFNGMNFSLVVQQVELVDLESLRKSVPSSANSGGNGNGGSSSSSSGGVGTPATSTSTPVRGILMAQTNVTFVKAPDSVLRLKGSGRAIGSTIVQPDFKFEDLGIGGLDSEFSSIFRRAFASRIFPPAIVQKLGIQHVKGILLYGPPGTGKTLIARQIGKMLNAKEPKIVNGPEVLNKYVGQSEENIRKLFADAEKEYKQRGDESDLHIIIFDELDAICKQRGSKNDGTGVGDSIVNQLLSKMDGVEQLNNILVIGMTNRLDMIDEALLRPGRLEVHMEIGLPDEKGRVQIWKIHTSKMRTNELLDTDVDMSELAVMSKNYSGAEIAGVVKSASSFAFNRHVKVGTLAAVSSDIEQMKVCRADFIHALNEVKPAFGFSETEIKSCVMNGIIHFSPFIERILDDGQLFIDQVRQSERTPLISLLLHGPPGSGKTALAATIAMASEFPFVKLISPDTLLGMSESAKMGAITKVFNDSNKSPFSVIVVDNIERILEYVPIGPRFSNGVLQTLLVLLKKNPPKVRIFEKLSINVLHFRIENC